MEKKRAPSARKAQEIHAVVQGQLGAQSGEELLRTVRQNSGRTKEQRR
jgi:hypothetical protein